MALSQEVIQITDTESSNLTIPIGLLQDLTLAQSEDDVLRAYSQWSRTISKADRCSVSLARGPEHLVTTVIDGTEQVPAGFRYPIDGTKMGQCFSTKKCVLLPDLTIETEPVIQRLAENGLRSMLLTPLISAGQALGILCTCYNSLGPPPESECVRLQAVAGCLATSLLAIRQMQELHEMAHTDALTKARNRHFLYTRAEEDWKNWLSDMNSFSYLMIDLDHFKNVNDTYGHDAGDAVLVAVVDRVRRQLRSTDEIIRMGGEEFCIILANCKGKPVDTIAQRVYRAIRNTPVVHDNQFISITASIGMAQVDHDDDTYEDCLKRADEALYRAKTTGRDQVVAA